MADKTEFLQAIDDAILDADSLERFINGSDSETVLTRLSAEYPTLQKALKEMFENSGIAGRFKTLTELQASPLIDGDYALVAEDDDEKNGLYVNDSGIWVKSKYDVISINNKNIDLSVVRTKKYADERKIEAIHLNDGQEELIITSRRGVVLHKLGNNESTSPSSSGHSYIYETDGDDSIVVSNRIGRPVVAIDKRGDLIAGSVNVSKGSDSLSTITFHGSSTMRFMQQELFGKLSNRFPAIKSPVYTNNNSGGYLSDITTEVGANNGYLTFTDNKIYANGDSPVTSDIRFGIPTSYNISVTLSNGIKGDLFKGKFVAKNLDSDLDVPDEMQIRFEADYTKYAKYPSVINVGKNNIGNTQSVVEATIAIVDFLDARNGGRTVVMGHTTNRDWEEEWRIDNVKAANNHLKALYLKRFFDLFGYIFSEEIWVDAGVEKTPEDILAIEAETLPPTFTDDGGHLNALGNRVVTSKLVDFIDNLGWY